MVPTMPGIGRWLRKLTGAESTAPLVRINGRRYCVVEPLRGGGNAALWVAKDECGVRVVLKRPTACFDDEDEFLFEDEYRIQSSLCHPNIVGAVDFGCDEHSGVRHIVMAYVRGKPLWQAIQDAGEQDVARYFFQSLRVCEYLRQRGIAHCDIKPDNVLIAEDRSLRLGDFGVATRHGVQIKGLSAAFVAPEHLFPAEGAAASAATDLYSLGVSFYWLLTGFHPYYPDGLPAILDVGCFTGRPAAPSARNCTLDPRWDSCLMGLIDTNPHRRTATAERILTDPDRELPAAAIEPNRAGLSQSRFRGDGRRRDRC